MEDTIRADSEQLHAQELQQQRQQREREEHFRARELHLDKLMREDVAKVMAIISRRAHS